MLGFADGWVTAAYLFSIGGTLFCVVYGIINWNRDEVMPEPVHPKDENLDFEDTI